MKALCTFLKNLWGNASVKSKLVTFTIALVLIPSVIFSIVWALFSIRTLQSNHEYYTSNVMAQTAQNINNRIDNITYILYDLSIDESLQEGIRGWNRSFLTESEIHTLRIDITKSITRSITKIKQIRGVLLTFDHRDAISLSTTGISYSGSMDNQEILAGQGSNIWQSLDCENQVIPISKVIYDFQTLKPIAYLTVFVNAEYFTACLQDVHLGEQGGVYLVENGLCSIGQALPESVQEALTDRDRVQWHADGYGQLVSAPVTLAQWELIGVVDTQSQQQEVFRILLEVIVVFLSVACILIVLCIHVSRTISRPIRDLQDCMERFSSGDFNVIAPARFHDEIGDLRQHFNKMAQEVNRLINRVYMEENLRQKAQIEALQMQINPHFLYNTLDTINWMSEINGQRDIAVVSRSLAALMRYSLRDDKFVAVEEEIEAVEHYIQIQHYRYGDELKLELQLDEAVLYENMPKHILLPLLENALEHGLKDRKGEKRITVYGTTDGEVIRIQVQDNGTGFPEELLGTVLTQSPPTDGRHMKIGLRNVDRRLKLIYGPDHGLHIASQQQVGTTVTVSFPQETAE